MRVTSNMLARNLLMNLQTAQGRMDKLQEMMSSGKRISKPSDDPVGIENAMRIKSNISAVKRWKTNAEEALAYMNTTDSILGEMTSMLQRIKELALQGASDNLSDADKQKVAEEVKQLRDQIIVVANTTIGSKYIFGGTNTSSKPLIDVDADPDVEDYKWHGNNQRLEFEVGSNLRLPISVDGAALFQVNIGSGASPTPEHSGLINMLSQLYDDLRTNNTSGVNDAIGHLEDSIDNVIELRADLGARTNRMEALHDQLDVTIINLTRNLSEVEDADLAETIIDFQTQDNIFRAALAVGTKIIQPSLVDFMR